jgi:DNA-binding MarR family transcriptional regulator
VKDLIDDHVELWARELPGLDLRVEGIATRLQVLTRYLDRRRDAALAAHGLQYRGFKTLHMLRRGGPPYRATPGELASQLGLSPAAMTNRLDALERLGYVRRDHDRDDRRRIVVTLTKPGCEIWQRGIGDISRVEEELINELDARNQDTLQALLRKLVVFTEKAKATRS